MTETLKSLLDIRMLRRTVCAAFVAVIALTASSAVPTGQWRHYPSFTTPASQVVATPGTVWYLSGGSLFSYDPDSDETRSWSSSGSLNDTDITSIVYNPAGRYLLVAYQTGNIDLIYDSDGHIVNIPDIRDSSVESSKRINGVDFSDGRIYIATDFGIVEYDDRRHEVVQSGIYNTPVVGVAAMPEYINLCIPYTIRSARKGESLRSTDRLESLNGVGNIYDMTRLNDSVIIVRRYFDEEPEQHVTAMVYDPATGRHLRNIYTADLTRSSAPVRGADGELYITDTGTRLFRFRPDGTLASAGRLPQELSGNIVGIGEGGTADVWALGSDGIGHYDLDTPAVLSDKYIPASMSVKNTSWIIPSSDFRRIYFTNMGISNYKPFAMAESEGLLTGQQTTRLDDDGTMSDVSLGDYVADWEDARNKQRDAGLKNPVSPTRLVEDPDDPSVYYLATASEGVFKIKDGKFAGRYDGSNSPIEYTYGWRVFDVAIDPEGNLWLTHALGSASSNGSILILPAEKRRMDPSQIKPSDWKRVNAPGFKGSKDSRLMICGRSNMVFVFDTRMSCGVVAIDTRGTYSDLTDDQIRIWTSFTDQDGKSYTPDRFVSIAEDRNGRVWLGSNLGIIEITNPTQATNSAMTVNRLKVPRNDGTNSADYLLGSDRIFDISVDNANRKWVATESSGLYLVSENGNEIIAHYTPENSPLPSNMVNCVYADRLGNSVFVGTTEGVYEFASDASPAMENFDEIYAYPNPVRPDYSGPITIKGLMDGSLVKIADAAGNVLSQTRAEGGMAVWDGCNSSGRRVPTGVYYVFASYGGEGGNGSSGAVTKILVID